MTFAPTLEAEPTVRQRIRIPSGLLGFEQIKEYRLATNPAEEPFAWLQVADSPEVAFLVVSPFLVAPGYKPDLHEEDATSLNLRAAHEAELLAIVTLRRDGAATINLKGPIVMNRQSRIAKQVVLKNAGDYSVQHPIPTA